MLSSEPTLDPSSLVWGALLICLLGATPGFLTSCSDSTSPGSETSARTSSDNELDIEFSNDQASGGKSDVYGVDNRRDLFQATSPVRRLARSVALLTKREVVPDNSDETVLLRNDGKTLADNWKFDHRPLCPDARFADQPIPDSPKATGFLVAPRIIATVNHAVPSCQQSAVVFDYGIRQKGETPLEVDTEDIYQCKAVVRPEQPKHRDVALIVLKRKVTDRQPLPLAPEIPPKPGRRVLMLGYPMGLPIKSARGRVVEKQLPTRLRNGTRLDEDEAERGFFTNLDAFGGNSGSPVITKRGVEGLLWGGGSDFEVNDLRNCYEARQCPRNTAGCYGNVALDVSILSNLIDRVKRARASGNLEELAQRPQCDAVGSSDPFESRQIGDTSSNPVVLPSQSNTRMLTERYTLHPESDSDHFAVPVHDIPFGDMLPPTAQIHPHSTSDGEAYLEVCGRFVPNNGTAEWTCKRGNERRTSSGNACCQLVQAGERGGVALSIPPKLHEKQNGIFHIRVLPGEESMCMAYDLQISM